MDDKISDVEWALFVADHWNAADIELIEKILDLHEAGHIGGEVW